jgi:hypothetical protein
MHRNRRPRPRIVAAVATLALGYLLVFYGHYAVLILLAVGVGWFEEGRLAARFHRPRFIDERFRGSVDPAGRG